MVRWKKKEPQDIVIECQNISLDPIDRIQTDSGLTTSWTSWNEALTFDKSVSPTLTRSEDHFQDGYGIPHIKERRMSDSATQTGKSLQTGNHPNEVPNLTLDDSLTAWSPADVCGLTTPPSEHMSPATSNQDLSVHQSNTSVSHHYNTPVMMGTPGESPTSSLSGDLVLNSSALSKIRHQTKQGPIGKTTPYNKSVDSSSACKTVYTDLSLLSKTISSLHVSDNQTSTPISERTERHSLEGLNEKILEDLKSEVSLPSEPVTPIDKLCNYDYGDQVKTETTPGEAEEQLTCGDHTTTTSENVAKEIKRILSESSFTSLEGEGIVPDNPPPSLEVSLVSDKNLKPEHLVAGNGLDRKLPEDNHLEDEHLHNHHERSLTDNTSSTEGISFVAKTTGNQSQVKSKSVQSQKSATTQSDSASFAIQQENHQEKDPLKLFINQNGNRQEQDEEGSTNGFKKYMVGKLTPVEILDSYIQVGSGVHINELCR